MLRYEKGGEPASLRAWQGTPGASWSSMRGEDKAEIRQALLRDQGQLCCYCQQRLANDHATMRVEHWRPQSSGADSLRWHNLLGACDGSAGADVRENRHCDVARGNQLLFLHPVAGEGPDPRDHLRYLGSGKVASAHPGAHADVEAKLNLNAPQLVRARRDALDALTRRLSKKGWETSTLSRELRRLDTLRPGDRWPPFLEVARYHLRRWIRKASAK